MNFYHSDDIPGDLKSFFTSAPQLGLEKTPEEYVAKMAEVFQEVRRVLRNDATLWLNLGDSYYNYRGKNNRRSDKDLTRRNTLTKPHHNIDARPNEMEISGFKNKDLMGIPWKVAFALRDSGWYLRSDIIWAKPNPMPESVTDRPTKAHEYLFLLAKSKDYYYDQEAIREPVSNVSLARAEYGWNCDRPSTKNASTNGVGIHTEKMGDRFVNPNGRNKRSVWTIATESYSEAHFATFPRALVEPCILAGTSAEGCCEKCGAPWERIIKPTEKYGTVGWQPQCKCNAGKVPCTVLDCFSGSGTTGEVAVNLGRRYAGIDLQSKYLALAKRRIGLWAV